MTKKEAIKWVEDTKEISAFTRNFVEWLYKNDYIITKETQVTEEFVEKWGRAIDWYFTAPIDKNGFTHIEQAIKQMLKEAGVEEIK